MSKLQKKVANGANVRVLETTENHSAKAEIVEKAASAIMLHLIKDGFPINDLLKNDRDLVIETEIKELSDNSVLLRFYDFQYSNGYFDWNVDMVEADRDKFEKCYKEYLNEIKKGA